MPAFLALLSGYVMSMFYRSFLAIVAGDLGRDLGFGASELSGLSSAWLLVFALSQIPLGPALDRFGAGRTVAACSLLTVVGAVAFALSQSYALSLTAMAAIGAGCAANLMGATVHVALSFPPRRFAFLLAVVISAGSLGQLLGATPLALASEAFGWRPTMLATALLSLISALASLLTVKDQARRPSPEGTRPTVFAGALRIARLPSLQWMLPVIFMSYAVVISERSLWIGPYLAETQGPPVSIGNVALVMSLLMALGALAFGPAARLMQGPKTPAFCANVIVGIAFIMLGLSQGPGSHRPETRPSRHHRIFRHELWLAHGARPSLHSGSPHRRRRDFHQLCFHERFRDRAIPVGRLHRACGAVSTRRIATRPCTWHWGPCCSRPRRFTQWRRAAR